jgi:hypothetical protein
MIPGEGLLFFFFLFPAEMYGLIISCCAQVVSSLLLAYLTANWKQGFAFG